MLHKYTKKEFINDKATDIFKYKLIHTPSQTVYSSKPHKFQEGYKVFISTTDKYGVFIDKCGMTQSIVFIMCSSEDQAKKYAEKIPIKKIKISVFTMAKTAKNKKILVPIK